MAEMTVADALGAGRGRGRAADGRGLVCFVDRMVAEHGCDGSLLWSVRFRDLRSPTATALENPLPRTGRCDCMVLQKAYTPVREVLVRDVHRRAGPSGCRRAPACAAPTPARAPTGDAARWRATRTDLLAAGLGGLPASRDVITIVVTVARS